ncbi:MAG: hypothetical protein HQ596_08495 [Candidatus Saganbacteria bacterium]|nr:hypothetical protein [Candidatus Saganbacteria bacterium]
MHRIIGKKIIKYSELDSTNDEAKRLIRAGLSEGVVIVAGLQTKGGEANPLAVGFLR